MSFPRYSKYKDSGVEWLEAIPAHWQLRKTKFLFDIMSRPPKDDEEIVTCFRDGVVTLRSNRRTDGFTNSEKEIGYQGVRVGDLVIHAMDGFAGAIGVSDSDGKSTPVYSVCQPRNDEVCAHYYGLLLRHMALAGFVSSLAKGIRERSTEFRWKDAGGLVLPLPPKKEQDAISHFLNRETAKIDALIAEQKQLIALLKEKRQAVISYAVTKGLNPDAPMKDSGIEWLGQIPAHWRLKRLKNISPFITVGVVVNPSDYVADEGLPFIYGGDISEGKIDTLNCRRISTFDSEQNGKTKLEVGDLLTVRVGAPGVTAVVTEECAGGNCASVMLSRKGDFDSEWLCYAMNSRMVRYQVEVVQYGAAQEQFNISHAVNFWIATPPKPEQKQISSLLRSITLEIVRLSEEAQKAIALLQERRSALISSAVTGKIDIRDSYGN